MSGILFNNIPASGLTAPIFSFEVNSGGQYTSLTRFIIIGHASASGPNAIAPNTPVPVYDQGTVDAMCGGGSMLREMFRIAAANAPAAPFWLVAVPDLGTAAQWTATIGTLPATGVGTIIIEGETIQVPVGPTDTPATVAAALAAAVNAYYNALTAAMLPITAAAAGAVVTFTARHKGALFNETDFWVPSLTSGNVFAQTNVVTLAQTVEGAGVPSLSAALAALGDDPADFIVSPWSDSGSLASYGATTNDTSGRWAWNRQSYGHIWAAPSGNFAALTTLGLSLNDRHQSMIGRIHSPQAFGTVTFANIPAANQTLTLNGTAVTFVTAAPGAGQVLIGADVPSTLANLLTYLSGSADTNLVRMTYSVAGSVLTVTSVKPGTIGTYYGLATTVANASLSGSRLAGSNGSPHASWLWATGFAAVLSPWLSDCVTGNVSRNHTGIKVQGVLPPRDRSVWPNYNGRNVLNNSGISTWHVGVDGSLLVDKIVTTYQVGTGGQPDAVFRDVQSVYQVAGGLKFMRAVLANEHGNKAIADANPGSLGAISTPSDIRATFIHAYSQLCSNGVFDNLAGYTRLLVVQRNSQNRARVDAFVPLERVSPLDILAANATVYQQLPQAA